MQVKGKSLSPCDVGANRVKTEDLKGGAELFSQ